MRITFNEKMGSGGRRLPDGRAVMPGQVVEVPDELGEKLCNGRWFKKAEGPDIPTKPKPSAAKAKGKAVTNG